MNLKTTKQLKLRRKLLNLKKKKVFTSQQQRLLEYLGLPF